MSNRLIKPNRTPVSEKKVNAHTVSNFVKQESYTVENFGFQWTKWRETQLDSKSGVQITRKRLERILSALPKPILEKEKNINLLEAGCGSGRFSEILSEFESINLTCVDLSDAVLANAENHSQLNPSKISFVKADILDLPYDDSTFDVVVCLGVVQHTPDSKKTLAELMRVLKPGGAIVWDHYEFGLRRYTKLPVLLLRPFVKRMSSKAQLKTCEFLINLFLPFHKVLAKRSILLQRVFSRISPATSYYHVYPELNESQQKTWAFLDTHDTLTAWYENWLTENQAKRLMLDLGAKTVSLRKGGNGLEVVSIKNGDK